MLLLVFPLVGDQVGLKDFVRVMPLSYSVLVPIPPYVAHFMAFV